jgi:hypothetical protein
MLFSVLRHCVKVYLKAGIPSGKNFLSYLNFRTSHVLEWLFVVIFKLLVITGSSFPIYPAMHESGVTGFTKHHTLFSSPRDGGMLSFISLLAQGSGEGR